MSYFSPYYRLSILGLIVTLTVGVGTSFRDDSTVSEPLVVAKQVPFPCRFSHGLTPPPPPAPPP
ncbi:MAG: hypothetical protein AAF597_02620, partial [Bacteroidota bacterium]